MARVTFPGAVLRIVPPWLTRTFGGRLMLACADVLEEFVQRGANGVQLRFPTDSPEPAALALTGRERRMLRGPAETATNYARRLRTWWTAHKRRGNAYAMLEQLFDYLAGSTILPPYDQVSYSGLRHSIDANRVVTRDQISWSADGSGKWARTWVFFYLAADPGVLSEDQKEVYRAIPRAWNAAHIDKTTIVILWGSGGSLLGYPPGRFLGTPPHALGGGGSSGSITFEV